MEEISILGAGIAGLTTAIALNNAGKSVTVFEAAPEIKAIGAGLGMGANAIKAFDRLRIREDVVSHGRVLESFTIYDQKGKKITNTNSTALAQKYGIDNFTIHRAELHKVLLAKTDPQKVFVNKKAVSVEQNTDSVKVKFLDGSEVETKFLIAADGIHSQVRQLLVPNSKPRYAGYTCWRAVIENSQLNIWETSETWGAAGRFGIVPLANNKIYWFACINGPAKNPEFERMKISGLRQYFKNFHSPIPAILEVSKDENLLWNDIFDLKPLNQFAFENILLIGDAAHATTPNLGQGACQAIEDAVILGNEINKNDNLKIAFKAFESRRLNRTRYITETSRKIGRIAQVNNSILILIRNFLFRRLPESLNDKQLEKLYNVDF